ncbi:hypothetical protein ACROYT_G004118 [Oculina patagonica]
MDPRAVILLIWILVSASMICENEAVFGPAQGKRATTLPLITGRGVFKEDSFDQERTMRDMCVAMRDVCQRGNINQYEERHPNEGKRQ